jgi:hypothetical protein
MTEPEVSRFPFPLTAAQIGGAVRPPIQRPAPEATAGQRRPITKYGCFGRSRLDSSGETQSLHGRRDARRHPSSRSRSGCNFRLAPARPPSYV